MSIVCLYRWLLEIERSKGKKLHLSEIMELRYYIEQTEHRNEYYTKTYGGF